MEINSATSCIDPVDAGVHGLVLVTDPKFNIGPSRLLPESDSAFGGTWKARPPTARTDSCWCVVPAARLPAGSTRKVFARQPPWHLHSFPQHEVISNITPPIPGILMGHNHLFVNKFRLYKRCGWDLVPRFSFLHVASSIVVTETVALKEIFGSRSCFPKHLEKYEGINFSGRNLIVSEGDEWKRHRRIVALVFYERNSRPVWDEAVWVMSDLFKDVWRGQKVIKFDHGLEITLPIALFIIGAAVS
ncbi:cytochrome p450 [Moniliophthora roreri]|nr:cytochrome p450 [Moniliophthora roreri]